VSLESARHKVAARITEVAAAGVPDLVVRPYGINLDAVESPLVLVYVTEVDPPSVACPTDVAHIDVLIVSPIREPGVGDDLLDDLHDLIAPALSRVGGVARGTSERTAYLDTWPAYRIPLEVRT
jgi:hypothetical protein